MHEDEVEVTGRAELGSAVAADGEQGDALVAPAVEGRREERTEPLVNRLGVGLREGSTAEAGSK